MATALRALPGLPPYGELPLRFSAHGVGTHSEGFVVEFQTSTDRNWVGNFVRGLNKFDWIGSHPNGREALVIAGGQGYLIDPNPHVRLEAEAVLGLIQLARLGELRGIGSDVLNLESSRNPDADKRGKVEVLLSAATSAVTAGAHERERGRELQTLGLSMN